jgi:TM2 domain-containing membrane protein YozV
MNQKSDNPIEYTTPNSLAAIWSMMLPGLGQMMKGQVMAGVIWGALVSSGYFAYFWPGLTFHALCILDAALYKGTGSFLSLGTWKKRFAFIGLIAFLLIYIVFRNSY